MASTMGMIPPPPGGSATTLEHLPVDPGGKLHIPELDGLRGIAILSVLLFHFDPVQLKPHDGTLLKFIASGLGAGWVGVDLFFALSGFLITGVLLRNRTSARLFRNFYGRRVLRIFPLYYGVLALYFVVIPLLKHLSASGNAFVGTKQLWFWLHVSNWAAPLGYHVAQPGLEHFWSLAVEEQFYLVWPLVVYYVGGNRLPGVTFLAVIISALSKWWCIAHHLDGWAAYFFTPCRVETLAVGSALAAWMSLYKRRSMPKLFAPACAMAACVILVLACRQHVFGGWDPVIQLLGFPCLAVLFTSAIGLALTLNYEGRYRQILRTPALIWLARYSYGIYVLHIILKEFALPSIERWIDFFGSRLLGGIAFTSVGILASMAAAFLSYHLFEKHFLRLKRLFPG